MSVIPAERTATCPSWCTDHVFDTDGALLSHQLDVSTSAPEAWVGVAEETDPGKAGAFVEVEVQGGNRWTPADVVELMDALVRAVRVLDPSFEYSEEVAR